MAEDNKPNDTHPEQISEVKSSKSNLKPNFTISTATVNPVSSTQLKLPQTNLNIAPQTITDSTLPITPHTPSYNNRRSGVLFDPTIGRTFYRLSQAHDALVTEIRHREPGTCEGNSCC